MNDRRLRALRLALEEMRDHLEIPPEDYRQMLDKINNLTSDDVGDIVFPWKCVMHALGYEHIAEFVVEINVIAIPPAVMVGFATKPGFDPDQMTPSENRAVGQAIAAVLCTGGWPITADEEGNLGFDSDKMTELADPWHSTIVEFRQELDTLFPDTTQDPLSKWMHPEEDE